MNLNLEGKSVIVTGGGSNIGRAISLAFAREGTHLTVAEIDEGQGGKVVAEARSLGAASATLVPTDVTRWESVQAMVREVEGRAGRVDVLVNNVGAVRMRLQGFLGTSDEEFAWSLQTNFFSAVRATRAVLPTMLKQGSGSIVNIASVNAFFEPDSGVLDYGAAKAALLNLTKSLAQEFGAKGIRVNAVSPGPVSTDLWLGEGGVAHTVARATGVDPETARKNVLASIGGVPTGRLSTPDEVAALAVLLASPVTANVTGSNYVIDGGLIKTT